MRIQNNIMALNTHRFYTINNENVAKSAEKLSSGYRINRAGDDAAGLAISEKMRAQIRGLNMATKNSQDAVSLVQTAEGALQEVHSMLQRMNELAVQAASGTNDDSVDRAALQQEFSNLQKEIDQIARTTKFNDMPILSGDYGNQGAAGGGGAVAMEGTAAGVATMTEAASIDSSTVSLDNDAIAAAVAALDGIAAGDYDVTAQVNGAGKVELVANGEIIGTSEEALVAANDAGQTYNFKTADGTSLGSITMAGTAFTPASVADQTTTVESITGLSVGVVEGTGEAATATAATFNVDLAGATVDSSGSDEAFELTVGGATFTSNTATAAVSDAADIAALFDGVSAQIGDTSYTVSVDGTKLTFTAADTGAQAAGNVPLETDTYTLAVSAGTGTIDNAPTSDAIADLNAGSDGGKGMIIQVGAEEGHTLTIYINRTDTAGLNLGYVGDEAGTTDAAAVKISDQDSASKAITATRLAINTVSTQRAELGAMQNRLEHKISNLKNTAENLTAAESRIRDVDIASEMSNFTKNNILSQAATAMLAQANANPQNVLSLLR